MSRLLKEFSTWLFGILRRGLTWYTTGVIAVFILFWNAFHNRNDQLELKDYLCLGLVATIVGSFDLWSNMLHERDAAKKRLELETDKTKPKIDLRFKRLTVNTIGRVASDGKPLLDGAYVLAWIVARNDGRESRLHSWHLLLRPASEGEPVWLGPIELQPRDWIQEHTFTDSGANGKTLTLTQAQLLERVTESPVGQRDNPEGFLLGKLPVGAVSDLDDLATRVYAHCQDVMFNTWCTGRIEGIHPGKVDVYDGTGARKYP